MRAIWQGSISFGLINIPVRLYSATKERKLSFNYLRKEDLCPIKYVKVCRNSGEEVPYDDIVKGYEYKKGDWVVLSDEDFKKADVKKTNTIEVFQFASEKEIDPSLYEKFYYLEPVKEARKAYVLLREALKKSKKVGIAKFVLRTKEKLAVVRPMDNLIILDAIRFADEIREPEELNIPGKEKIENKDIEIAVKLIDQLTEVFKLEKYHDTYTEELERVISEKSKGKVPEAKGEIPVPVTEMEDIMAKLRESLAQHAKKEKVKVRR
ncbi:MAG TPA: Ku protein [Candidatus Moranbacteria bacterium]|nr:Ku protein [Candidatus Moranbacteria bacterium]